MSMEGFRTLNQEIETIINKSEAVKKARREANDKPLSPKAMRELTKEEKEYKSLRKQIQEKLVKFATRVPIFMYLTDYRERSLKDVITQLEPGLFKKVTGLTVKDFESLVSLGVFNSGLMNDAVYKFKRYEDASLSYVGINKHDGEDIGLYDTVITQADARTLFKNVVYRDQKMRSCACICGGSQRASFLGCARRQWRLKLSTARFWVRSTIHMT